MSFHVSARRQRAFTLIELLVVVLIVGILVAIAAPAFLGQSAKAQNSAVEQQLAVARKEAKAVWTSGGQDGYPALGSTTTPGTLLGQLQASEPQYTFLAGPGTITNTGQIDVWEPAASEVAMCEESPSGVFFCFESSEIGGLPILSSAPARGSLSIDAAQAASSPDIIYSTGCQESYAVAALTAGSSASATVGWSNPQQGCPGATPATAPVLSASLQSGSPQINVPDALDYTVLGTPTPTVTIQWYDCDAASDVPPGVSGQFAQGTCTQILGTTNLQSYTPQSADSGSYLAAVLSATNVAGHVSVDAITSAPVPSAPILSAMLSSPAPVQNVQEQANASATGNPTPTLTYQWYDCNSASAVPPGVTGVFAQGSCSALTSATTTNTYTPASAGYWLVAVVSAQNSSGTVGVAANASVAVAGPPSASVSLSSPTPVQNVPEQANASATGTPNPTLTYQWYDCNSASAVPPGVTGISAQGACSALTSATTTSTYTPTSGGYWLAVVATATNSAGSDAVDALGSAVVGTAPTVSVSLSPASPEQGVQEALSASLTGIPNPTITSYAWYDCSSASANPMNGCGASIGSGSTYPTGSGDVGQYLTVVVTVTNSVSSATAYATPTLVSTPVPTILTAPTLNYTSGVSVGAALTTSTGSWTGSPSGYTYTWQYSPNASTWTSISGTNSSSWTVTSGYSGYYIRAKVIASNAGGQSAPSYTTATNQVPSTIQPAWGSNEGEVAYWESNSPSYTASLTTSTDIPAGDGIFIAAKTQGGTADKISSISDGYNAYYADIGNLQSTANTQIWHSFATTALPAGSTITVSLNNTEPTDIEVLAFSGLNGYADQQGSDSYTGNIWLVSGNWSNGGTDTYSGDLQINEVGTSCTYANSFSDPSGWTEPLDTSYGMAAWTILTGTTASMPTWDFGSDCARTLITSATYR